MRGRGDAKRRLTGLGVAGRTGETIKMASLLPEEIETVPHGYRPLLENLRQEAGEWLEIQSFPNGEIGGDVSLSRLLQQGDVQIISTSLQNLSPFAPAVGVANLPFFIESRQELLNLLTSEAWEEEVEVATKENGFFPLMYAPEATRMFALGPSFKNKEPPLVPSDIEKAGITHRVAGSEVTKTAFNELGTNTTSLPWPEVASSLQEGVINSTYNFVGWHVWGGFHDQLYHEIVPEATPEMDFWAANNEWIQGLPNQVREAVIRAGEKAMEQQLSDQGKIYRAIELYDQEGGGGGNGKLYFLQEKPEMREAWKDRIAYDRNPDLYQEARPDDQVLEKLEAATQKENEFSTINVYDVYTDYLDENPDSNVAGF
jgi:TRAP-type C4-dicarboxylate transport system substrate-binding protein